MKKLLALFVVVLGFSGASFALTPVDATATASATILGPITISKTQDLNFGNLAVNGGVAGDVTLPAVAAPTLATTGGVVSVAGVAATSARFTVSGVAAYAYTITKPASIVLTDAASNTMTLTLTGAASSTSTLPVGGSEILYVGGTLTVAATQAAGTYTNASDLKVTVNYN